MSRSSHPSIRSAAFPSKIGNSVRYAREPDIPGLARSMGGVLSKKRGTYKSKRLSYEREPWR